MKTKRDTPCQSRDSVPLCLPDIPGVPAPECYVFRLGRQHSGGFVMEHVAGDVRKLPVSACIRFWMSGTDHTFPRFTCPRRLGRTVRPNRSFFQSLQLPYEDFSIGQYHAQISCVASFTRPHALNQRVLLSARCALCLTTCTFAERRFWHDSALCRLRC